MSEKREMKEDEAGDPAVVVPDVLHDAGDSRGVETLQQVAVIDEGEASSCSEDQKIDAPVVLRPTDLGRLAQVLGDVVRRLDHIEQVIADSDHEDGRDGFADTGGEFGQGAVNRRGATKDVVVQAVSAPKPQRRLGMFAIGVIAGLVLGILLVLFTPRMLPAPVETAIASTVMGERWRSVAEMEEFTRAHKEKLSVCAAQAAMTMQDQFCVLRISPLKP